MIAVPFWGKFRWNIYEQELINLNNHSLLLSEDSLVFQYKNMNLEMDISSLESLDINIKKDQIISIKISLLDGSNCLLSNYKT